MSAKKIKLYFYLLNTILLMVKLMNIFIYIFIFIAKIVENALATLRLIVVANGKKTLGAILQLFIALVWVLSTHAVVNNISADPLKILVFALGSFIGSFVGSYIEEKLAMGNTLLFGIIDKNHEQEIVDLIRKNEFDVTTLPGESKGKNKSILMILTERKKRQKVASLMKNIDKKSMVVEEDAKVAKSVRKDKTHH